MASSSACSKHACRKVFSAQPFARAIGLALSALALIAAFASPALAKPEAESAEGRVRATPNIPYEVLVAVEDPAAEPDGDGDDDELPPAFRAPEPVQPDTDAAPEAQAEEAAAPPPEPQSVFTTWWFWALAGGLVIGTVAAGIAVSGGDSGPLARGCEPGIDRCFGDGT